MGVDDVVVLDEVFPEIEVVGFHLDLCALDRLADHSVFYGLIVLVSRPVHYGLDALAAEPADEVVVQSDEEPGVARVSLAPGTARSWLSMRRASWRSVPTI